MPAGNMRRDRVRSERYERGLENAAPVMALPVLQTGLVRRIGGRVPFEHERAPIGKDQAIPGEQHAALPEAGFGFALADEPGTLGYEKQASRRAAR